MINDSQSYTRNQEHNSLHATIPSQVGNMSSLVVFHVGKSKKTLIMWSCSYDILSKV